PPRPAGPPLPADRAAPPPHVPRSSAPPMPGPPQQPPPPPAEHHHPVPVGFLTAGRKDFAVDLVGDEDAVDFAAEWLTAAGDSLGLGGKTAAGYGYLDVAPAELDGGGR